MKRNRPPAAGPKIRVTTRPAAATITFPPHSPLLRSSVPMPSEPNPTRRDFLAASAVAGSCALAPSLVAGQNSALKVGLVGCGGRGTGAAKNTLKADSNVKLVAMADIYDDQI